MLISTLGKKLYRLRISFIKERGFSLLVEEFSWLKITAKISLCLYRVKFTSLV